MVQKLKPLNMQFLGYLKAFIFRIHCINYHIGYFYCLKDNSNIEIPISASPSALTPAEVTTPMTKL